MFTASLGLAQDAKKTDKKSEPKKETDASAMGECHGINACKGKGECGGEGHACAGNNACKGKGWIQMSKKDCKKKHGTFK